VAEGAGTMKFRGFLLHAGLILLFVSPAHAATWYVATNGLDSAVGTNWATAKQTIQAGVDAATNGDIVLVSNGVYATGAQVTPGYSLPNRVVIANKIAVRSVNGPATTIIQGQGPLGDGAIRCVFITNGILDGFTLTNGSTFTNGFSATNSSWKYEQSGGGAYAVGAVLTNCILSGNSAFFPGGGVYYGTLYNCILTGNSAPNSGGAERSTLYNCILSGNSAGGGAGASWAILYNCTLSDNHAAFVGGGTLGGTLNNCILYHNTALSKPNYNGSVLTNCCTIPDPGGTGNITNEPALVSLGHIAVNSPCVGKGSTMYASGVDIDGEPWGNPPAIGCDQPLAGALTGLLSVAIVPQALTATTNIAVGFAGQIEGRCSSNRWEFGDGDTLANAVSIGHAWSAPGDYAVVLLAFNEDNLQGVAATVTVHVVAAEDTATYVWTNSPMPAFPYTSWSNAAHTIQEAVNAQTIHGGWVVATDGVYSIGAQKTPGYSLSNRVVVTNNILVRSVNGHAATVIQGLGPLGNSAVRCVFITSGTLVGFTLTNGFTFEVSGDMTYEQNGGGAFAAGGVLKNCRLTGNGAGQQGGGVAWGQLYNCTLTANSARWYGGGNDNGLLVNCTITGNSAWKGGGVYNGILNNCIVYHNTAIATSNNVYGSAVSFTCTTPLLGGPGNITNEPAFLNTNGWSDLRLASGSAGINAGTNQDWMLGADDLAGNPRIVGTNVDLGAYEYPYTAAVVHGAWLRQFGLPTDGSADLLDSDHDNAINKDEFYADTNPTNPVSVFGIEASSNHPPVTLYFHSSSNRVYTLNCATNLLAAVWTNVPTQTRIPGNGTNQWLVETNDLSQPRFYRIGVDLP
jgi:hypothetical protein